MTDFKSVIKRYKLIIFLSSIAAGLVVLKYFFLPEEISPPQPSPSPTPMLTPSASPLPLPTASSPAGRGDPNLLETILKDVEKKFPLNYSVPYEDENFSIDYVAPLKLKAVLKTPQASQSAVLNWIRSKNVDPSTHQIEFVPF